MEKWDEVEDHAVPFAHTAGAPNEVRITFLALFRTPA